MSSVRGFGLHTLHQSSLTSMYDHVKNKRPCPHCDHQSKHKIFSVKSLYCSQNHICGIFRCFYPIVSDHLSHFLDLYVCLCSTLLKLCDELCDKMKLHIVGQKLHATNSLVKRRCIRTSPITEGNSRGSIFVFHYLPQATIKSSQHFGFPGPLRINYSY